MITSAPVAVGNSISGAAPVIRQEKDGVRVQGRDFMFQVAAVAATRTDWVLAGGCPLIPHAFVASVLRSYAGVYANFVVHGVTFHYITSSATNTVGDVMFYIGKSRASALLDTSDPNFMSVVLSDPSTVLSPLWKNCAASYRPVFKTYSTDILNDEDLRSEGPGELFVYTRSASLNSPGYVLIDFDITFKTLQVNIRNLTFPMNRLKYQQYGLGYPAPVAVVQGAEALLGSAGLLLDGVTVSGLTADAAIKLGDVFKIVFCAQYATLGTVTLATMLQYNLKQGIDATKGPVPVTIDDGFTCFGVYMNAANSGLLMLYPTVPSAMTQRWPYEWGLTNTVSINMPSWISLIGNVGAGLYQSNY